MVEEFQASSAGISRQLASGSHRHTSFSPERRAEQEISGFTEEVQGIYDDLKKYAKTEAQKELLNEEMARFQGGYAAKKNVHLASKGRCFSSMITGASGFNNRAHDKANNAESNKYDDMVRFKDRAISAIKRDLKKLAVEEQGGEIPALEHKITELETLQDHMKTINAILRKKISDADKLKEITEKTRFKEEMALKLLTPDFAGRVGFTYHLQNNNQNINSAKKRLAQLKGKEEIPGSELTFAGGRIIDNAEADRVQIFHDSKPSPEIIEKLKSEGWRWYPFGKCWQRKRTAAAMMSAKRIIGIQEAIS